MINLIVILDPSYEAPLGTVAQSAPVWIVASAPNKFASQLAWATHPTTDHRDKGAVTCFDITDPEDRLANLLNVLPTLEEHHGEICDDRFAFPKGFVLKVIGLPPATNVFQGLQEFGFSSIIPAEHGFEAHV